MTEGQVVGLPTRPSGSFLAYLSRMSFLTDFTPATLRVTETAVFSASFEVTKPLNWTTPLNVSTLISADFSVG